eukprot:6186721-Pyramimonas_sp.AAC.1
MSNVPRVFAITYATLLKNRLRVFYTNGLLVAPPSSHPLKVHTDASGVMDRSKPPLVTFLATPRISQDLQQYV